jgi:DNA-binding beta-propeller fold protein YncE
MIPAQRFFSIRPLLGGALFALASVLPAMPPAVTFDGVVAPLDPGLTPGFNLPTGVACGPGGKVYVPDSGNGRLVVLDGAGIGSVLTGLPGVVQFPTDLALDGAEDAFVASFGGNVVKISPGVNPGTTVLPLPSQGPAPILDGIALDAMGNLFVSSVQTASGANQIQGVPPSGHPSVLAITGLAKGLNQPSQLTLDLASLSSGTATR